MAAGTPYGHVIRILERPKVIDKLNSSVQHEPVRNAVPQTRVEFIWVPKCDNACNNDSIHAVCTFSGDQKHIIT